MGSPAEPWLRRAHGRLARGQGARYDRETSEVMRRVLRPASTCVDVGSYRGAILRQMVTLAPRGRHFAFEPVPENHRYLQAHFPTAHVARIALADYHGEGVFHHAVGRPARSGLRRVAYPDPGQATQAIPVVVDTLDRSLPADTSIDLLKIDVEGGELAVLRGGASVIRRSHPVVVFECGSERAAVYGVRPEQLYDFLRHDLGLQVSLMRRWLDGRAGLHRAEFCELLDAELEFCFLAYAGPPGGRS
jgi:FkbM family methyltransferase